MKALVLVTRFCSRGVLLLMLILVCTWTESSRVLASSMKPSAHATISSLGTGDENWDARFGIPGIGGGVNTLWCSGSEVIAGGAIGPAGNAPVANIARWDGSAWSTMGSGLPGSEHYQGIVYTVAKVGDTFYAGGQLDPFDNLAYYQDGTDWQTLSAGANEQVRALQADGTDLYVGGAFNTVGGVAANGIARWDGTAFYTMGEGVDGTVAAIAIQGTDIYVAGGFWTTEGSTTLNNIARWDGAHWVSVGSGVTGDSLFGGDGISSLAVIGTDLYAGGHFKHAGGVDVNNIARWDGSQWHALDEGISGADIANVSALTVIGSDLFVGGSFTQAGNVAVHSLARWDGAQWHDVGGGVSDAAGAAGGIGALTQCDGQLYVGGGFEQAGGLVTFSLARWDGSDWHPMYDENHLGLTGGLAQVHALARDNGYVYAAGTFQRAGLHPANGIARWDGSDWSALGTGIGPCNNVECNVIYALESTNGQVYAGGSFGQIGGITAHNIARWDGTVWHRLKGGLNGTVHAILVHGKNVYVGGSFTQAGRVPVKNIARWDGKRWHAVGGGVSMGATGVVYALAFQHGVLYAGGEFSRAGEVRANNIAAWDGTNWSALGKGTRSGVMALATSQDQLYVGGAFTKAGGKNAAHIARWNGKWHPLGQGLNGTAIALAAKDNVVYVGGYFFKANSGDMMSLAKWDGTTWSWLGSEAVGINALLLDGNQLYAGGSFQVAGNHVSSRFGIWHEP